MTNLSCTHCVPSNSLSELRPKVLKFGFFYRKSDHQKIPRFRCCNCLKTFSLATTDSCLNQKKRLLNPQIYELLCSGLSQRRAHRILRINRKTVARKLEFLGSQALLTIKELNKSFPKAQIVEFDDLETFEHTKCKPLSVTMMVEHKTRRILGFKVSQIPAKGLLAAISRKKYGPRKDKSARARNQLMSELKPYVDPQALIKSDMHTGYPTCVRKYFPHCTHRAYKSRKACITGQGELKKGGFDPLFSLNHTFAMYRANINRLFRRTWNTTKDPKRLADHIAIYSLYHNTKLI